jgi:hypothetical protein
LSRRRGSSTWRSSRSAFDGIDGRDVMAILWGGCPDPGTFSFQIDDLRLR